MPEGPEIRLAADKIAAVLQHRSIESAFFGLRQLSGRQKEFEGQTVTGIETRGKALLTHFNNGKTIYSHNQLYGVWKIVQRGKTPNTNRSLRLALHTATHSALLYSASDISVWRTEDLHLHPFLAKVGPDILDPGLSWQMLAQRLVEPGFRGRRLASLYLDQTFLAGVGNYLRSEILFFARLNPFVKPAALSRGQRVSLARASLAVSRRSYRTRGLTNRPTTVRALRARGHTRAHLRFAVFGREGQQCYDCGAPIKRCDASARRLYHCPVCQGMPCL